MTTHNPDLTLSLTDRLNELNQFKIDLGLDRLKTVLHRLKLHDLKQQIILVGGTNGKGSTVAALCSMLEVKSKQYGAFTSPHLFKFNERIQVNGIHACDDAIMSAFADIDEAKQAINLSYFEYAFLAAMLIFKQHDVDVIVLEVGLGGRLDATNVMDADVSIITTVDIDHTEWLGHDIESIAYEKAGIMRALQPVIFGDFHAPQSIIDYAQTVGAKLIQLKHDFKISFDQSVFTYQYLSHEFVGLNRPVMKGDWQLKNVSSALTAMIEVGYQFTDAEIQQSIDNWQLEGRLQTLRTHPMVLADVAHNKQSISQLVNWLLANPIDGKTRAVFSVLNDKQLDSWLGLLHEVVDHWFVFQLKSERGMAINQLKLTLADHVSLFSAFATGVDAYNAALISSRPEDRVIIFGSFHVLEEVLEHSSINKI